MDKLDFDDGCDFLGRFWSCIGMESSDYYEIKDGKYQNKLRKLENCLSFAIVPNTFIN